MENEPTPKSWIPTLLREYRKTERADSKMSRDREKKRVAEALSRFVSIENAVRTTGTAYAVGMRTV
jgi:hypothetical protein